MIAIGCSVCFFLPFHRKKHVNSLVNGNDLVLLNISKYHAITDVVHKGLRVKDIESDDCNCTVEIYRDCCVP